MVSLVRFQPKSFSVEQQQPQSESENFSGFARFYRQIQRTCRKNILFIYYGTSIKYCFTFQVMMQLQCIFLYVMIRRLCVLFWLYMQQYSLFRAAIAVILFFAQLVTHSISFYQLKSGRGRTMAAATQQKTVKYFSLRGARSLVRLCQDTDLEKKK